MYALYQYCYRYIWHRWYDTKSHFYSIDFILIPLSWLYRLLFYVHVAIQRFTPQPSLSAPLLVIGNFIVGGAGKTPLVIALVNALTALGWQPLIICKGYRGTSQSSHQVHPNHTANEVGDEALLIALHCGVPVWVGSSRKNTIRDALEQHPECDIIVSDDGLQSLRYYQKVALAVMDQRMWGNGRLIPAGPMRQLVTNKAPVNAIVRHNISSEQWRRETKALSEDTVVFDMHTTIATAYRLTDSKICCPIDNLVGELHAVAGIGNPFRFFDALTNLGLDFTPHIFPDHHHYRRSDFDFVSANSIVITTEKDAIKWHHLKLPITHNIWVATLKTTLSKELIEYLDGVFHGAKNI